jgi:hypothetical protein
MPWSWFKLAVLFVKVLLFEEDKTMPYLRFELAVLLVKVLLLEEYR